MGYDKPNKKILGDLENRSIFLLRWSVRHATPSPGNRKCIS